MPDGRARNGGARAGAGRKPRELAQRLHNILDAAVPDAEWLQITQSISRLARAGNIRAAEWLMDRKFGKPSQNADDAPEEQYDYTRLTDEELEQLRAILTKALVTPMDARPSPTADETRSLPYSQNDYDS